MNKYFKVAGWCVVVAVAGGLIGSHGNELQDKFYARNAVVNLNNTLNASGKYWHQNPVVDDSDKRAHTIKDATGQIFKDVPYKTSDADFIKHFGSRPEWKGHKFFGNDYIRPFTKKEFNSGNLPDVRDCDSFQNILTDKIKENGAWYYSNSYDNRLGSLRDDYIRQCAWNSNKDMSYTDKEATDGVRLGDTLVKGWFGLLALLGTIPAIWIGFWRVIGVAVRSAKSEIKGDKEL
ncbi:MULTISPECIES: hypothetical protein [unclassified Enterobacter cloacae complex]|uniref:hypothetical protein n=1 Tax=Enterobacter cloacae complex TaxID=354276 RepID=UPI001872BF06|nr:MULTISPECIES: hypothetical protein [unclassified Enterobacter cloacae complex]MBE4887277.1 hypothetical protein [Enterobacter cloacae complex sp. P37RS]MBE7431528.1 hypothetical protein [Enterobacter cloacae complex sp. P36RS]MCE1476574.1 hypothetical protein [Enterobacter hormaechei]